MPVFRPDCVVFCRQIVTELPGPFQGVHRIASSFVHLFVAHVDEDSQKEGRTVTCLVQCLAEFRHFFVLTQAALVVKEKTKKWKIAASFKI